MSALTQLGFSRDDLGLLAQFFADLANLEVDRWAITHPDEVGDETGSPADRAFGRTVQPAIPPESAMTSRSPADSRVDLVDLGEIVGVPPPLPIHFPSEEYRDLIRRHREANPELHGRPWVTFRRIFGRVRDLPPKLRGREWASVVAVRRCVEDEIDDVSAGEMVVLLLDGEKVVVEIPHAIVLNARHQVELLFPPAPGDRIRSLLFVLLSDPAFPFARCAHCRTIYVRDRVSRKFCARTCLVASRLKDSEEQRKRKEYMRAYMKARRARMSRQRNSR